MPLTRYHKQHLIDPVISTWLDELYTLPAKDAVDALNYLCQIEKMGTEEANNAPDELVLPEALQAPRFANIQDSLQALYRIMRSPDPQKATRTHEDQGEHTARWGVFNLNSLKPIPKSRHMRTVEESYHPSEIATAENVYAYLIEQFQVRIWIIENVVKTILPHIQTMLGRWKQNAKHKQKLYKAFFALVKHKDTKPMQFCMQTLLQALKSSKQKNGVDVAEEKQSIPQHRAAVSFKEVAKHLSLLPPEMIDLEMTQLFEAFCQLQPMSNSVKMHASYNAAHEKIIQQINSSKPFPHIEAVISSFALVHRVYLLLEKHRLFCEQQPGMGNVRQLEAMCHRYVVNINAQDAASQQGLSSKEKAQLANFEQSTRAYLEENHHDRISNFFVRYFGPNNVLDTKDRLHNQLIDSAFVQNNIIVDDPWLSAVLQNQQDHGFLDLSPYHINRIFLHACLTPPDSDAWSRTFYQLFTAVIDLVENGEKSFQHVQLQRASYPDDFIQQLKFLRDKYAELHPPGDANANGDREEIKQDHVIPPSAPNHQPPSAFPLMYFPNSLKELAKILQFLPVAQGVAVCTYIQHNPSALLLKRGADLSNTLYCVDILHQAKVLDVMLQAGTLLSLIRNTYDFQRVMQAILTKNQAEVLGAMLKAGVPLSLIQNVHDFQQVMRSISTEAEAIVLNAILQAGVLLPLIRNTGDLQQVMQILSTENQAIVLDAIWKAGALLLLIQKAQDFQQVMGYFAIKDREKLFGAMLQPGMLLSLIRNIDDLRLIMHILSRENQAHVLDAILQAGTLLPLIQTTHDFRQVMRLFLTKNEAIVLNAILQAGVLLPLIRTAHDFHQVTQSILKEHEVIVLDAILKAGALLPLIQNIHDFQQVIQALSIENQAKVLDAMLKDNKLLELIQNIDDFQQAMLCLSITDREQLLGAMLQTKAFLPLIRNVDDLRRVMQILSIENGAIVLDAILQAGTLLPLIQNAHDFQQVMRLFATKNEAIVLHAILQAGTVLRLLQNTHDFHQVMQSILKENEAIVLNAILKAGVLLPLIQNTNDFRQVIQALSIENQAVVLDTILHAKAFLTFIRNIDDFQQAMLCLSIKDREKLLDAMLQTKAFLPLIRNIDDLHRVKQILSRENQAIVLDAMLQAGALLPLIQNAHDFQQVMGSLETKNEAIVLHAILQEDVPLPFIRNINDFRQVMQSILKENEAIVLDAILRAGTLLPLIRDANDLQQVMQILSIENQSKVLDAVSGKNARFPIMVTIQKLDHFQRSKQRVGFFDQNPINDPIVRAAQWLRECLLEHNFHGLNEKYYMHASVLREGQLSGRYGEVLQYLCQYGPTDQAKIALLNKLEDYLTEKEGSWRAKCGMSDPETSAACAMRDALKSGDILQLECISRDHVNVVTEGGLSVLYKAAIQLAGRDDNVQAPEAKEEHSVHL